MCDRALTVREVSELLGIRQHGVLALIRSGELLAANVSLKQGGRPRWRIMPDALDAFIESRTHKPAARTRRRRKQSNVEKFF